MPLGVVTTAIALRVALTLWGPGWAAPDAGPPATAAPAPPASSARPPEVSRAVRPIGLVATREPVVAITFDACATRSNSYAFDREVFDILKRERIPATIFVSGRWVEGHPDVMAELAGDSLIEFGDHSYDHPHMAHLPVARILEEIGQTEAALGRYGRHSVAFRPPYGEWSRHLIDVIQETQLPTVTWDVVSGDPSARTTVDRMVHNVVDKARAGSIIIFHINGRGWKTAEALPTIVRDLRARGFRFVLLSELMAGGGPAPIPNAPAPAPASSAPAPPVAAPIPAAITSSSSIVRRAGPQ